MTRETLKLFWRATWRYKWLLIIGEIAASVLTLTNDTLSPLIVSKVIDKLSQSDVSTLQFSDFNGLLWLFILLQILYLLSVRVMMHTYIRMEPRIVRDLENLSFKKLQEHSLAFFADNFSGALVAKVNRLTAAFQRTIETVLGDFGNLARRYVAAMVVIVVLNPFIAAVFFAWSVFFCLSVAYLHKKKMWRSRAAAAAQTRVTARLADIIANTLTIRSFARSREETEQFSRLTQERSDLRFRSMLFGDFIRIFKGVNMVILNVLILWLSVRFSLQGTLSVGSVVLIQFYLFQLLSQLWNFGRFMDRLEESLADASEMTEIIMLPHEVVDPEKPEKSHISEGEITFQGVTFHYSEAKHQEALFRNLDLNIKQGQKIGLVGPSGGGKTTFTKLLLRFMDIDGGEILIDGQNIAKLRQEDLRQSIAYVPQEPLLFHRSIYENIAYGNPKATKKDVIKAAKDAHADEFIQLLDKKYDTIVGERGVKLSGGQRQRVAIARAMLKKAPIIVLDEATSSLDSVSEKLITSALDRLMAKRTTIVIAHRLSTIRKMDRILVMEDGNIIEDGTHQRLLKQKGLYAKLWGHQSGEFIGED